MIPYTLIIASASRPHLLAPTLTTLFAHVDQLPNRVILHDDCVFGQQRQDRVVEVLKNAVPDNLDVTCTTHNTPIGHGPSLHTLLRDVTTEYVLYTQDDHVVLRDLPVRECLEVMDAWQLHHVRFNKRDTMPYKETWQGRWYKIPVELPVGDRRVTLTISDHWYFQTSLWRVAHIRPVIEWFMENSIEQPSFHEHAEIKINDAMNGNHAPRFRFYGAQDFAVDSPIIIPPRHLAPQQRERDPFVRAQIQRTFIWGGIDEKAYIRHIGHRPFDFALNHPREEIRPCEPSSSGA